MNGPVSKLARCAIYTRKSTEYNLELAFNSLDAQREACEAYIKSQAHEGWRLIPDRYDDGAFSGASLERPALQQLLADVRSDKIDIVLVYKVDRLTRSLADFAKLIELFDAHGVSFVSVTQSFNTSSSMGRLTLNVLLSFAQFERELIGERVRDKIAASKRKGLWVGGPVPLGYAAVDKKILVVPAEAEAVRTIFARYLALGSIRALADELDRQGIHSKRRRLSNGRSVGGKRFGVGALAHLLTRSCKIKCATIESSSEQRDVQAAAHAIGQELIVVEAGSDRDIEAAFAMFTQRGAGALFVGTGSFLYSRRARLVALAAQHKIPTIAR
jgi:DNA invertase Pin-like site-specific DNA recombinase